MTTVPSTLSPHRELHGFFADFASLFGVAVRAAADERALEVAKGVRADALQAEKALLEALRQQIAQRAGAGKLDVAVIVTFLLAHQFGDHRRAVRIRDSFGNGDRAQAVFREGPVHVGEEFFRVERAFRHIDEVWAIVI